MKSPISELRRLYQRRLTLLMCTMLLRLRRTATWRWTICQHFSSFDSLFISGYYLIFIIHLSYSFNLLVPDLANTSDYFTYSYTFLGQWVVQGHYLFGSSSTWRKFFNINSKICAFFIDQDAAGGINMLLVPKSQRNSGSHMWDSPWRCQVSSVECTKHKPPVSGRASCMDRRNWPYHWRRPRHRARAEPCRTPRPDR